MAQKDVNGSYWLEASGIDNIYSQCDRPIKDGDKIFIDADGIYHKNKKMIEVYHYNCIVETSSEDSKPEN